MITNVFKILNFGLSLYHFSTLSWMLASNI